MVNTRDARGRPLASPLPVRLFADQKARYEELARASNTSLQSYLRDRLDADDQTLEVLGSLIDGFADLDRRLADIEERLTSEGGSDLGVNYELLLLLRILVRNNGGEQSIKMVQADIKRLGFEPFEIEKGVKR